MRRAPFLSKLRQAQAAHHNPGSSHRDLYTANQPEFEAVLTQLYSVYGEQIV